MKTEPKEPSLIAGERDLEHLLINENGAPYFPWYCYRCGEHFNFSTAFICANCDKPAYMKSYLDCDWFPKELPDGSSDWNSVKKDNPKYYPVEWSHGRLNIKTMEMERVPIDRQGKKYDYLDYQLSTTIEDKKIENAALQKANGSKKSAKEIKQEIKIEKDIEKRDIAADKEEKELTNSTTPSE